MVELGGRFCALRNYLNTDKVESWLPHPAATLLSGGWVPARPRERTLQQQRSPTSEIGLERCRISRYSPAATSMRTIYGDRRVFLTSSPTGSFAVYGKAS